MKFLQCDPLMFASLLRKKHQKNKLDIYVVGGDLFVEHKDMAFPTSNNNFCNQNSEQNGEEKWAKEYSSNHKILLLGEGDFSFSASLAAAFGNASNMTATSFESEKFLEELYDQAIHNIEELKRKGCNVMHGVNATFMASNHCLKGLTFDRIIFNFPLAVVPTIGHKSRLRPHQKLIRKFLKAAKKMISENGEIHITQRTDGVIGELRIEFLAFQQWLELVEVVDFNVCDYPGYSPKWGIGSDISFEHIPSKTYKFRRPHPPIVSPSSNNNNLMQNVKGVVAEEKWVKHYCSSHMMLLVGEGDFSFTASLAEAFGSASNMIATSLHRRKALKKIYEKASYNIKELKRKGCKVMQHVDATAIASNRRLKGLTFDRIVFNFPYSDMSKNDSSQSKIRKNQALVSEFLENAKKMIDENGEIHITHRTDGDYGAWRVDFLASQHGLELVEAVDFSITEYPNYNPKWGIGGDNDFDWFPSKTYKFRHSHPPGIIIYFGTLPEPAICSNVPNSLKPQIASNCYVAPTHTQQLLNLADNSKEFNYNPFEKEFSFYSHQEWCMPIENQSPSTFPISMNLPYGETAYSSVYTQPYPQNFHPSSKYGASHIAKQNRVHQAIKTGEKWIKHYSSCHKILLVGEGDFSFSASLAVAFDSAFNMTATSLDSEDFLTTNYCKAFLHLRELKNRGCKVMHGVDVTSMAYHPCLMGSTFDRVIFNFPHAGFYNRDVPRIYQIGSHQALIWKFLENTMQMIGENGEIHITHKTNGFHQQWNIPSLAILQGLELVGIVDFNVSDYPGYSNKYGFGGDNSFDSSTSMTYMFRLPRTAYFSWPCV